MNNINLVIGDTQELIDFNLLNILKKITYNEDDKIIYDMNNSTLSDVLDEASMMSLFGNTKVIIGNDFDISKMNNSDKDYLERYIKNINKNVYIILITSKVDARLKNYKILQLKYPINQ